MPEASPDSQLLQDRRIIVAVCGGIAAYKVADVVSKLVQQGAAITVAMTAEAQKFVGPLTFEALSGRKVRTDCFDLADSSDPQHIALTENSDLMLIAPATANMIAKIAHGLCDDIVSLLVCAASCPVVLAPSMNNHMWKNPVTRENVAKLQALGYEMIGPDSGWLACRNVGPGRMTEPGQIVGRIIELLRAPKESSPKKAAATRR